MNRYALIGLALVAAAVAAIYWSNRGAQIRIEGSVQKTRLQRLADHSTMAVFDFRFTNPADFTFVVREVVATCTAADGKELTGEAVSEDDARRIFDYYKLSLGDKFNESLVIKSKIPARATQDRMIAATFPVEPDVLERRKGCVLRVEDVDGAGSIIREIVK